MNAIFPPKCVKFFFSTKNVMDGCMIIMVVIAGAIHQCVYVSLSKNTIMLILFWPIVIILVALWPIILILFYFFSFYHHWQILKRRMYNEHAKNSFSMSLLKLLTNEMNWFNIWITKKKRKYRCFSFFL